MAAIILAVWLGWQAIRAVFIENAPPNLALRVASDSPTVLSRAAESELAAGRHANAARLARASLTRSPFSVRALRTLGLAESSRGNVAGADEMLTLAGNWSLRDDPAHAWLIERRLRQGAYSSAFSHADTIVRRRRDLDDSVFTLFTTAANLDARGLRALASQLRGDPPWRKTYLENALRSAEGQKAAINLAVMLEPTAGRFSSSELEALYLSLLTEKRTETVRVLVDRLNRTGNDNVQNGGFDEATSSKPFNWMLLVSDGVVAEILPDDVDADRMALRVEYSGYSSQRAVDQALLLQPGIYELSGSFKAEGAQEADHLQWVVTCLETGRTVSGPARISEVQPFTWGQFSQEIVIPSSGCSVQWLSALASPGARFGSTVRWFDDLEILP